MSSSRAPPRRPSSHDTTRPVAVDLPFAGRMLAGPQPQNVRARVGPGRVRPDHRPRRARTVRAPHRQRLRIAAAPGSQGPEGAQVNRVASLFGTELPIVQAPMAGVQLGALAAAVSSAGGLGSLPCAMLTPESMAKELNLIRSRTDRPLNVNFFCHVNPPADAAREAAWRAALSPYYREFGVDPASIASGPARAPFSPKSADALEPFKPEVVSFHFGLPEKRLLDRVKAWGSKV